MMKVPCVMTGSSKMVNGAPLVCFPRTCTVYVAASAMHSFLVMNLLPCDAMMDGLSCMITCMLGDFMTSLMSFGKF